MSLLKLGYKKTLTSIWVAFSQFLIHWKAGTTLNYKIAVASMGLIIAKALQGLHGTGHI